MNTAAEQLAQHGQGAGPESNGEPKAIDQPAKKTTDYTVLWRRIDGDPDPASRDAWTVLSVESATSQQQARRKALDRDEAMRATDGTTLVSLIDMALGGARFELVAVAVFEPVEVKVEQPPPPPPKIRC